MDDPNIVIFNNTNSPPSTGVIPANTGLPFATASGQVLVSAGSGSNIYIPSGVIPTSSGVTSIDQTRGILYNNAGNQALSWFYSGEMVLIAQDGGICLDWGNRLLYNNNGFTGGHLPPITEPCMDWQNGLIYYPQNSFGQRPLTIDWKNCFLYGAFGAGVIDWGNGYLKIGNIVSVDWTNKLLYSSNGESLDYGNLFLLDNNQLISIDWNNRTGTDINGIVSIDYNNRYLMDTGGNVIFSWGNGISGITGGGGGSTNWGAIGGLINNQTDLYSILVSISGGSSATGVNWGAIGGTLSAQTDLNTALNNRVLTGDITTSSLIQNTNLLLGRTNANSGHIQGITPGAGLLFANSGLSLSGVLYSNNNLSDVGSTSTSRSNLGLGNSAILNTGTSLTDSSSSIATDYFVQQVINNSGALFVTTGISGNFVQNSLTGQFIQTGVSGSLLKTFNNLSDISSSSSARTNLGLGNSAVLNTGTSLTDNSSSVATDYFVQQNINSSGALYLKVANNLSDVTASTARTNLGLGNSAVLNTGVAFTDTAANTATTYWVQKVIQASGGGSPSWGSINGTLSNQTDLQAALTSLYIQEATGIVSGLLQGPTGTNLTLLAGSGSGQSYNIVLTPYNTGSVTTTGRMDLSAGKLRLPTNNNPDTIFSGSLRYSVSNSAFSFYNGQRELMDTVGWCPYAYPIGSSSTTVITNSLTVTTGELIAIPIIVPSHMMLNSLSLFINAATAPTNWTGTMSWMLYQQLFNNANQFGNESTLYSVSGASGTFSGTINGITSSAAYTSSGSVGTYLAPGTYYAAIINNSTGNLSVGSALVNSLSNNLCQFKTAGSLTPTLDFTGSSWTKQKSIIGMVLKGNAFGQTIAF